MAAALAAVLVAEPASRPAGKQQPCCTSKSPGCARELLLVIATAFPAFAHHSHPLVYDWCKSITVEGRVESVEYKNPHSIIVVRQDEGTAYTVD